MAPSNTAISGCLRQVVYYHLDNFSYENALFFAEKLSAQDPRSPDSSYLLALAHYHNADFRSAYEVSRSHAARGTNICSAWIFAQSCLQLERWRDGINALEKIRNVVVQRNSIGQHSASIRAPHPDLSSVLCLLGKLYRGYDDKKKAVYCFEESLKVNPMQWDAFTALCDMGVNVRVQNIFRMSDTLIQSFDPNVDDSKPNDNVLTRKNTKSLVSDSHDPFETGIRPPDSSFGVYQSENGTSDFLSKIAAARSKLGVSSSNTIAVSNSEGLETPPNSNGSSDNSRAPYLDAPSVASRRLRERNADLGGTEAPSKMMYRLGATKRTTRSQDKAEQPIEVFEAPLAPVSSRYATTAAERKRTVSGHPVRPPSAVANHSDDPPAAPQRRSARLNMFRPTASKANSSLTSGANVTRELKKPRPTISRLIRPDGTGASVGRVVSGNRKPIEENIMDVEMTEGSRGAKDKESAPAVAPKATTEVDTLKIEESLKWLLELLRKIATGYSELAQFRPPEAVHAFQTVPKVQQETPWVLSHLGKAQLEQSAFIEAEKCFRKLRSIAPTRLKDMELYSTILWQLKRETDLSFLAHELIDVAWHSPEAWCSLGNAWSLSQDHEQALRCFKRATQLNPKFAYAFTLQGHEHMDNEEYEKALTAYRQAIAADRRHYKAYFGIGQVYRKLGNFERAFMHYQIAANINPSNPVLLCAIGTALEKQKNAAEALIYYSKATELFPKATDTRYKKARALMTLGEMDAARRELLILKDQVPDEAPVHFLLGKLYRNINQKQLAVRHFTNALALDPKASLQIKEAIETFEEDIQMDDSIA
ncbi:Protein bimA [Ceratocystis fimbriata CBS 114723]|uniref:Protein bimA n=1 Tax=Ceratocystis fimbriata CBS 114723 TaxID=1035309 RepID=A0A2C5X6N6_9PEZI|nr:Protein bimA [Ceratocystis fimbriata CBS 114723]